MGLLDRVLKRRSGILSPELKADIIHSVVSSEGQGRGASLTEELRKSQDVTNFNLTHDDAVEKALEADMSNPISFGIRVASSPLVRQAVISEFDAGTYKLEAENDFDIAFSDMEEDEWEAGGDFLASQLLRTIKIGLDCAVRGHVAQLVKSMQTVSRVSVEGEKSRQKGEGVYG